MSRNDVHDHTFKNLMAHKEFFMGFLQTYLPQEIFAQMDWSTAKIFKISGEHLREVFPFDTLKKVKLTKDIGDLSYLLEQKNGEKALVSIHIEHQSTPDALLPLRMSLYLLGMLYEYAKMNQGKLPHLYSLIYYHGTVSPYPHAKDIFSMFDSEYNAKKHLFHPVFIDLGVMPDDQLLAHQGIAGAEITFKHIFAKNLTPHIQTIAKGLKKIDDESRMLVLKYMITRGEALDVEALIDTLESALPEEETLMTIAEQLEQRGVHKGYQQGKLEELHTLTKNMLLKGFSLDVIAEITGLSVNEIIYIKEST